MTLHTCPYVSFPGNARQMLEFYQSVFGGELRILTYGEQLDNGVQFPFDPPREAVAHAMLRGPFTLSGGDDLEHNRDKLSASEIGFTVESATPEDAQRIYEALAADGGQARMPFAQAPWGEYFGMVVDRFNVGWNVTAPGK